MEITILLFTIKRYKNIKTELRYTGTSSAVLMHGVLLDGCIDAWLYFGAVSRCEGNPDRIQRVTTLDFEFHCTWQASPDNF